MKEQPPKPPAETPPILDRIADVVLNYKPKPKRKKRATKQPRESKG